MKHRLFTAVLAFALAAVLFPQNALAAEPLLAVSEAYGESEFYQRLCAVELTGDYRADIVNVALSQVGYHEGDSREDYAGGNHRGWGNFIEYSSAFFGFDGQWCALFVSWCARQAGIPKYIVNSAARAAADGAGGTKQYFFHLNTRKPTDYVPVPGDLVFFSYDGYNSAHTGIVAAVTEDGIRTVEGNSNNAVRINSYALDDPAILRYGVYSYEAPRAAIDVPETTELRFASWEGEEHGLVPDGDGGYCFETLYGVEGRMFQLPDRAFCRNGLTLLGYYVRRSDGLWLTDEMSWAEAEQLRRGAARPYLVSDGSAWRWEAVWAQEETLELHCVWADDTGAALPDPTAAELCMADGDGWKSPYRDVWTPDWFYGSVKAAAQRGVLTDEGPDFFPGTACSRLDFVTWLYRVAGTPAVGGAENPFTDLETGTEDAVCWAYGAGIIHGLSEDCFGPASALTREQAAAILHRATGAPAPQGAPEFTDAAALSDWAVEAVTWAQEAGVILGVPTETGTAFQPGRELTRAEALSLVLRVKF